ncbi:von Willebrand factor D and EGF domain-containing protein-like isoform X3 [Hydractinia symbiolongicarpus]|uniref:von Willebrand factor D and EGF domain-containing protein-like isoform X3 n=1 Tax=Hydractinia symbiolongicarpus TaxID=13093 RepID=UPI00254E4F44|nr:von Willebrand factor D and EGF domain-containing protein-like isoform X3 [Hydractinia symbiolongicarpus]
MLKMRCYFIITLYLFGWSKADNTEPCADYTAVDNYQRSIGYKLPSSSHATTCDRKWLATWYRFTSGAGGEMPTSCPPKYGCGSKGSVWLDGTNPTTVGETKKMKACLRAGTICCSRIWEVRVKKCSKNGKEYFVYYLPPTPGCPMRYCAGKETKCEEGESSPTGFTPGCSSKYPKLKSDPVISVGVKNKRMQFKCKFDPKERGEHIRHVVTWYQGPPEKKINKEDTLHGDQDEAYLQNNNEYGEKALFCLGQNIYCKVQSHYVATPKLKSIPRKSNEFFAGFKITPKVIDLSEKDKPRKLTVTSTLPIVCQDGTENCEVLVELGQTNTDNFIDYCTMKFKPGPAGQTHVVEVVAKRDFVDDGDQTMHLKIHIPDHVDPVDWNCYKNITDVLIKTKDVKTKRCTSTGDPHIRTFDGLYYNHFLVGDYVMVESGARLFQVHVRTFRCHTVSCNCGIAVREGDDVIVVDMCRDNIPRARFASTVEPQKGTTIERNNNGKSFVLNFPSGAYVRFDAKRWFRNWYYANIVVQLPSDDYKNTTGLCGTFDGKSGNDMTAKNGVIVPKGRGRTAPKAFTESWKLTVGESLFYYKGGPRKCLATRAKSYCTCQETCCGKRSVNCNFEGYSQRPKYIQGFRGWKRLDFPGAEHCGRRKRRAIAVENVIVLPDDGETGIYTYNPKTENVDEKVFPTKSGKTEAQAKTSCTKAIQDSTAGKACIKMIAGYDINEFVDQCVFDVKVTDDYKVGFESAINTMIADCEEKTLRDLKYWKNGSSGVSPPIEIGDSVCPNECSGRGSCQNATCVCDKDYITADCSLKKGQAPTLLGVPFNGLCDIRKQDCYRTRVMGMDFIDSTSLTCRMTEVVISDKPYVETTRQSTDVGQLLSFGEISCLLPRSPVEINGNPSRSTGKPTGGFLIGVSNDGTNFSHNKTLFLVYDSKCMDCGKDYKSCIWKQNSCKVSNYCFAPGDANPNDWCQVCDPNKTRTGFVKRTLNKPPVFKALVQKLKPFKAQTWRYVIPASDPEKQRLTYEFVGNNHGMMISSAGVLTWYPTQNKTYEFTIQVTDPCGLSATQKFMADVKSCICEGRNGGICVWKGTQGVCQCPSGCKGEGCDEPIDGRICRIKSSQTSEDSSDTVTIAVVAIIVVIVVIVTIIAGVIVYVLKKKNKPINLKSAKDLTLNAGRNAKGKMVTVVVGAYNSAHRTKDENVQMKFGGLEKGGSSINDGYVN